MPTTFQGLSGSPRNYRSRPMQCNTAGLVEGSVVIYDTSKSGQLVKAPTAAGNTGVAGVIVGQQATGGTAVGDLVEVAYEGIVPILLGTTQAVTVGDKLIVAGTDGSVKGRGASTGCDVIAVCEETRTAGANNELITGRIQLQLIP